MTHNQIIIETFKSLSKHSVISEKQEDIIKLILENLMLSAKIELLKEINERRE